MDGGGDSSQRVDDAQETAAVDSGHAALRAPTVGVLHHDAAVAVQPMTVV